MGTEEFFTWPVAKICYWKGRTRKPKTVATLMAILVVDFFYMQSVLHKKGVCAIIEKNERKLCREIAGSKWFQELKHGSPTCLTTNNSE